jgi:membrane associated rhomboid family serine protease
MGSRPLFPRRRGVSNWRQYVTPAIRNLVLVCTGVYLVELLLRLFAPEALGWMILEFGLVPYMVLHRFAFWQPVTYLFLHDPYSLLHLLFNMLFLWMFGVDLERAWGSRRLYIYFFITGISGGLINVAVESLPFSFIANHTNVFAPTIGASGAIYGILLAAAVMFPDREIWLFPFPVRIPMKIYVLAAGAIEFFMTLGIGGDSVSHVTHLGGMLVGYLYLRRGSWFFRARNGLGDWQRKRARRRFEVYMRKHRDEPPSRPGSWVN